MPSDKIKDSFVIYRRLPFKLFDEIRKNLIDNKLPPILSRFYRLSKPTALNGEPVSEYDAYIFRNEILIDKCKIPENELFVMKWLGTDRNTIKSYKDKMVKKWRK